MVDANMSLIQPHIYQVFLLETVNVNRSVPVWQGCPERHLPLRIRLGNFLIQSGLKLKDGAVGQPIARLA